MNQDSFRASGRTHGKSNGSWALLHTHDCLLPCCTNRNQPVQKAHLHHVLIQRVGHVQHLRRTGRRFAGQQASAGGTVILAPASTRLPSPLPLPACLEQKTTVRKQCQPCTRIMVPPHQYQAGPHPSAFVCKCFINIIKSYVTHLVALLHQRLHKGRLLNLLPAGACRLRRIASIDTTQQQAVSTRCRRGLWRENKQGQVA